MLGMHSIKCKTSVISIAEKDVWIYSNIPAWIYSMKQLSLFKRRFFFFFLAAFIPYNEEEAKVTPAEQVSQSEPLSL